jgi:hypothetical protein
MPTCPTTTPDWYGRKARRDLGGSVSTKTFLTAGWIEKGWLIGPPGFVPDRDGRLAVRRLLFWAAGVAAVAAVGAGAWGWLLFGPPP